MNVTFDKRGYCLIGLFNPKSNVNVGSVLRAAGCFGVNGVITTGNRYNIAATDPSKTHRHIPLFQVEDMHGAVPYDCVPVAIDLVPEARPIQNYVHPERAIYIFGAEDGTLGKKITSWCRDIVYIQTNGCMNLSHAVSLVLYDRALKRNEWYNPK